MNKIFDANELDFLDDYLTDALLWNKPTQKYTVYLLRELLLEIRDASTILKSKEIKK